MIKITFLGCGTSTGVPMIGCDCGVCTSADIRNRRTRSSIILSVEKSNILIDTATDLRYQSLKNNIRHIEAVLFTHDHADHVHGIDELRSFNFIQKEPIPCYGDFRTLERIKKMFSYIFTQKQSGGGIPRLEMNEITDRVEISGLAVTPVEVLHGELPIFGYRFADTAYVTDCSQIPDDSMEKLLGLELLILGALRYTPHSTHFNIDQALAVASELKPKRTVLTHLSHEVDFLTASSQMPEGVSFAYDGLSIEVQAD